MKKVIVLLAIAISSCSSGFSDHIFVGSKIDIKNSAFAKSNAEQIKKIESLIPDKAGCGPTINDRDYWEKLKAKCPVNTAKILEYANKKAFPAPNAKNDKWNLVSLPGEKDMQALKWLYEPGRRNSDKFMGDSARIWEQRWNGFRTSHLQIMTLAECLENKGRFLPHIKKVLQILCSIDSWGGANYHKIFKKHNVVNLSSQRVGANFSASVYMLADKLPPELRQQAWMAVKKFIINPFMNAVEMDTAGKFNTRSNLTSGAHWLKWKINWNPVCLSGVVTCAVMLLDDKHERAAVIAAAQKYITDYKGVLLDDGYYVEGISYWAYGFDHHVIYAELLYRYSQGRINAYTRDFFRKMAAFPYFSLIQKNLWITFADVHLYSPPLAAFTFMTLHKRLGIKEYKHMDKFNFAFPWHTKTIYTALCDVEDLKDANITTDIDPEPTLRHWFKDVKLLISRDYQDSPKPFSGAIKGSIAAKRHTHSDSGSFAVAYDGKWLLCDPGYPSTTKKQHWTVTCGSYHHPVPLVDGKGQETYNYVTSKGIKVLEQNFSDDCDMVKYDLRYAYVNRDRLKELSRRFSHDRKKRVIEVSDTVEFKDTAGDFESALMTFSKVEKIDEKTLRISENGKAIRLEISSDVPFEIKTPLSSEIISKFQHEKLYRKKPVPSFTRIAIKCRDKVKRAQINIRISPEELKK